MPRVKFFAVSNAAAYHDEPSARLLNDISDWTEITSDQLVKLQNHRYQIERELRDNGSLCYDEQLLIVKDISAQAVENAMVNISQIIDSVAKKQKATEEKRAATEKKRKENAEKNRVEKELKQLEKLKQKYGGEA
jgi:flagellar biosynthesis chaperone FliJ